MVKVLPPGLVSARVCLSLLAVVEAAALAEALAEALAFWMVSV